MVALPRLLSVDILPFFALFLLAFFPFLARRLPPVDSVLVLSILAFSPVLLAFEDNILSDITFLFFSITAGAVLVIYFYVVPQLESNLVSQKVHALRRDSLSYIRPFQDVMKVRIATAEIAGRHSGMTTW